MRPPGDRSRAGADDGAISSPASARMLQELLDDARVPRVHAAAYPPAGRWPAETTMSDHEPWWSVWCARKGEPGFWRNARGTNEPLQTTRTEAERVAASCNEFQRTRTDSLGWVYTAMPYKPIIMRGGIPMWESTCPPEGPRCLACDRLGSHLEPTEAP